MRWNWNRYGFMVTHERPYWSFALGWDATGIGFMLSRYNEKWWHYSRVMTWRGKIGRPNN